jgi:hypothetical protein
MFQHFELEPVAPGAENVLIGSRHALTAAP